MSKYGKITRIRRIDDETFFSDIRRYEGFEIQTENEKRYLILVDNEPEYDENCGYICLNDDTKEFVGKEISKIEVTRMDDSRQELLKEKVQFKDFFECQVYAVFVDFLMVDGTVLQFAIYNEHNGYYGHDVVFAVRYMV